MKSSNAGVSKGRLYVGHQPREEITDDYMQHGILMFHGSRARVLGCAHRHSPYGGCKSVRVGMLVRQGDVLMNHLLLT
jgi:hypothetical protein